jgi:glycosyltransferase involved in cell wall biosynthesis
MKFDFYLSEMAVSDKHGGGLTMQRILGEDLLQIPLYVHLGRFALTFPPINHLKSRSINLLSFWEQIKVRRLMGNTLAASIAKRPPVIRAQAKRSARKLAAKFKDKASLNVLVCPQSASAILTLEELKSRKKVNYITWVMDDHLVKYTNDQWTYPEGLEVAFKKHLQEAAHVFVISQSMQQFYKEHFNIASTVLFGPADMFAIQQPYKVKIAGVLNLGYFGAVTSWQMDGLTAIAGAVNDTGAAMDIYSVIENLPAELNIPGVTLKPRLNAEDVLAVMQTYDAIVLPISFAEQQRSMSQLNIATKMSECLACGVPILAIGPPYAAMITYLEENKAAIIAGDADKQTVKQAISQLSNAQMVNEILANAKTLAINETSTAAMRKKWQAVVA